MSRSLASPARNRGQANKSGRLGSVSPEAATNHSLLTSGILKLVIFCMVVSTNTQRNCNLKATERCSSCLSTSGAGVVALQCGGLPSFCHDVPIKPQVSGRSEPVLHLPDPCWMGAWRSFECQNNFFQIFCKIRPCDFSLGRNMFLNLKVDLNGKFEQEGEKKVMRI